MDDDTDRAAAAKNSSPFLTTGQAAFYVGLSPRTLERMRWASTGPRFRRHGRYVRYHIVDLEEWSAAHEERSSRHRVKSTRPKPHHEVDARD